MSKKFYITTPIYYVNARPHIGHAYTTIACDTIARRQRLLGAETFFLTGTDEHGQKIERAAQAAGKTPQQYADEISAEFRQLWNRMGISNDDYIRTTEDRHKKRVQVLFRKIRDNGYIYKGTYTGQYCVSDELYVDGAQPGDPCPTCGRITETVKEENYFFKLSAFQDKLLGFVRKSGVHSSGDAAQRSDFVRALGAARFVDQPLDFFLGHSGAGRSQARDLRVAGRAGELHYRDRLRFIARRSAGGIQEILARRRADDWQRNRPLPLRLLAGVFDGGGIAGAEGDCGAWMAAV